MMNTNEAHLCRGERTINYCFKGGENMSLFEITPYDKFIYETELKDFLPNKILDVHTHVWLDKDRNKVEVNPNEVKRTVNWPDLVAKDNSIEDLQETYRLMFPGKDVKALMFAGGGGSDKINAYVSDASKRSGFPALYYSHPNQSADEVEKCVRDGGFLGLKSYLDLSPKYLPSNEIRIFDFFPKYQLERMNEMGAIVMLHIPRSKRFRDPVNLAQISEIKENYKNLRLVIAHIGRAYTKEDVGDAFEVLSKYPDLMFDFCANCCEYAITEALRNVGPKRLMFGTDMPILRMRTHRIEENGTYINLIPPGLYGDPSQDPHLREVSAEEAEKITFFAYEELLSFKRACKTLGLTKADIEDVMYNNAYALIEGARKSIYGE